MKKLVVAASAVLFVAGSAFYSYNMRPVNVPFATIGAPKVVATSNAHGYTIDTANSLVEWVGSKPNGKHNGVIGIKAGSFKGDGGNIAAGSVDINMTTITCSDLTGGSKSSLEGHLKAPDFFDTEKFGTANFAITKVTAAASDLGTHNIEGNLTLKGITKSVTFPATVASEGNNMTINAAFNIDRTQWGIVYGQGKVANEIALTLKIKATAGAH
jgi:polyisoprenoid-binding protein YceI